MQELPCPVFLPYWHDFISTPACNSSFSFQLGDSENVRKEIENKSTPDPAIDTGETTSGDESVPLTFRITENIILTEDDEEHVVLPDHKVAATREVSGGTYSLLVATAPDCQDHGTASINATTGEVKFGPDPGYHGICNLKIQFQESASSKVEDEVTVTVQEYCSVNSAKTPYANSGTSADGSSAAKAYRICTAVQLNNIGSSALDLDKHFLLKDDLDLSDFTGSSFNIIGGGDDEFSGVFDGNNHIISNFTYSNSSQAYPAGLFGTIDSGTVKNLHLRAVDLTVDHYEISGSLVGDCFNCTIGNVSVSGQISVTKTYMESIGGIAGACNGTCIMRKTASNVIITSSNNTGIGGIVDENDGVIEDSYAI